MKAKLNDLWACEESKIQELRQISQDQDRAWESELQAVQKHLATAIAENQKLNIRLQKAAECEPAHSKQVELVQEIEKLKIQINEPKESESGALEQVAEMEGELRRLKVQMEQWRKAAEVATAMVLDDDGGGKFVESVDISVVGEKLNSSCLDDTEDESTLEKMNMLQKIRVLLKKGQK